MGTDVHMVYQTTVQDKFVSAGEIDLNRNYMLFSILANVRNGRGFAGVKTYEPVPVIAMPRGLPPDIEMLDDDYAKPWLHFGKEDGYWLGDHSHSYLTVDEVLAWPHWGDCTTDSGIVERAFFDSWDGKSQPESWCGGISGGSIVVGTPDNLDGATHVRIQWQTDSLREMCEEFFAALEYMRLHHWSHGPRRIVFGFDS